MITINTTYKYNITDINDYLEISAISRVFLILLTTLIVVMGLFGNFVVLYGSIKYNAINMDRVSTLLLECLAGADFMTALLIYFSMLITLGSNKWVFGDFVCFLNRGITGLLTKFECLITAAISCYRLYYVLTNGLVAQIQIKYVWLLVAFLWLIPCCNGVILIISDSTIYFNPYCLCCWATLRSSSLGEISRKFSWVLIILPMIIIVTTNTALLIIAVKYSRNSSGGSTVPRKAIIAISSVCWAFIISWLPTLIDWMTGNNSYTLITVGKYMITLNVVVNPVIYSITNNKFRSFLKKLISRKLEAVSSVVDSFRQSQNTQDL